MFIISYYIVLEIVINIYIATEPFYFISSTVHGVSSTQLLCLAVIQSVRHFRSYSYCYSKWLSITAISVEDCRLFSV